LVGRPASLPHKATSSALQVCTPLLDWYITWQFIGNRSVL
jgi:hypothetical protein